MVRVLSSPWASHAGESDGLARVSGGAGLTEGALVISGGQIGGGSAQEVTRDQWACMQRRGSSRWCRRSRSELRQEVGDVDVLRHSWIKQEEGVRFGIKEKSLSQREGAGERRG
jgi:hypothetical protein